MPNEVTGEHVTNLINVLGRIEQQLAILANAVTGLAQAQKSQTPPAPRP